MKGKTVIKHRTHKRNSSDFLHVVGKDDLNIVGIIEDSEKVTANSEEPLEENISSFFECSGANDGITDN